MSHTCRDGGRYRFSSEGDEALHALVQADAIRVAVELVRVGAGHGTAHESAEAMR